MKLIRVHPTVAIVILLWPLAVSAEEIVPAILPFQAKLTNANGDTAPDGAKIVQFQIYDAPTGGAVEWAGEVHKVSVNGGLVNVLLGTKNSLEPVNFAKTLYLQITIDSDDDGFINEADPPLLPRQIILPSFFAREAANAQNLDGFDWDVVFGTANHPNALGGGSPGFVPGSRIESGTVTTDQIRDGTITGADITSHEEQKFTGANIQDGSLTSLDLKPGDSVSGAQIKDESIQSIDIEDGSVTSADIRDGTIGESDIDTIPLSKLSPGTTVGDFFTLADTGQISNRLYKTATVHNGGLTDAAVQMQLTRDNLWPVPPWYPRIRLVDDDGNDQVEIYVKPDGDGFRGGITADTASFGVKNFVVEHPTYPDKEIVYTSLEGPEIGMYCRGVVSLDNGRAKIELPDHFTALAIPGTISVSLSPNSLSSKGLAVVSKSIEQVEIGELHDGRGSYDVDYMIFAVRQGYPDYEPVRPKGGS